jgi:hypothetical protein
MAGKWTLLRRLASWFGAGSEEGSYPNEATANSPVSGNPLSTEWATYQAHKEALMRNEGQWVVIHGEKILGIRATYEEALKLGYDQAGYVDFLTHQILSDEPVYRLPPQPV